MSENTDFPSEMASNGDCFWRNSEGQLHRDHDLPAIQFANGTKHWMQFNVLHRDNDEPAVVQPFASGELRIWVNRGLRHRDGGRPAYISLNFGKLHGYKYIWYVRGVQTNMCSTISSTTADPIPALSVGFDVAEDMVSLVFPASNEKATAKVEVAKTEVEEAKTEVEEAKIKIKHPRKRASRAPINDQDPINDQGPKLSRNMEHWGLEQLQARVAELKDYCETIESNVDQWSRLRETYKQEKNVQQVRLVTGEIRKTKAQLYYYQLQLIRVQSYIKEPPLDGVIQEK